MRRFEPPLQRRAVFYKFGDVASGAAVSELGIFGTFLGCGTGPTPQLDVVPEPPRVTENDEDSVNSGYSGYLLRTKGAEVDEGGVATGFAVLNSLYLVPDDDFCAAFGHRT